MWKFLNKILALKISTLNVSIKNVIAIKVTVDLRGVFLGKQYSALCINGKYINLYIIGELI